MTDESKPKEGEAEKNPPASVCSTAVEVMTDVLTEVCGREGARVVRLAGSPMNFVVPGEVANAVGGLTLEQATDVLYSLPWSREWSKSISAMVYGKSEWEALPAEEQEKIQKRLIREKLAPELLK